MHSFFVVPFVLAVFAVLFFSAVRILTMEEHSVYDYLADVREGGATKRWQAAFELSRKLSDRKSVPTDAKFVAAMSEAFEQSKGDDDRVRQYLAMAMGRTGNKAFTEVLLKRIDEEKDENLYARINALGILADTEAVQVLLHHLNDEHARIRLATVIALGNLGDQNAVAPLKAMLNDPEPNVVWDAAVGLAKMGDRSAKGLLLNMMDRSYLNAFPNVSPQAQTKIMMVAMRITAPWHDPDIKIILKKLFECDKNMNVRALARQALNNYD